MSCEPGAFHFSDTGCIECWCNGLQGLECSSSVGSYTTVCWLYIYIIQQLYIYALRWMWCQIQVTAVKDGHWWSLKEIELLAL